MFFEQQLGIKPAAWLQNPELDVFLEDNCIPLQLWEEMAVRALGLHMTMIRLIVAAVLCIPVGVLHRFVPSATGAPPFLCHAQKVSRIATRAPCANHNISRDRITSRRLCRAPAGTGPRRGRHRLPCTPPPLNRPAALQAGTSTRC